MTAPEVLVAEAREALLNGPVFRVRRAETAPGGVKAVEPPPSFGPDVL